MALSGRLENTQSTILTQTMQQSLNFLSMPAEELGRQLQELSMSNPFIETEGIFPRAGTAQGSGKVEYREWNDWRGSGAESDDLLSQLAAAPVSYTDHLNSQLGQMHYLQPEMLRLCRYIVGCLNSAGYLDCSLEELAKELGVSFFDMEQALFVVQSLDPAGTGARDLSECLVLQLAQSASFCELNVHMARYGLTLLSRRDYGSLAKAMNVTVAEVKKAADVIRTLNPIPSQGFYTYERSRYIIPELIVSCESGQAGVQYNSRALPGVGINSYYSQLVGSEECVEAQPYLKEKLCEAKAVVQAVEARINTMDRLLKRIVAIQEDFFTCTGPLRPMTMQELAKDLGLSVSTVSRAVKDKYIQFNGQLLLIRSLFSNSIQTMAGDRLSSTFVRTELVKLIRAEDREQPLTDDALCDRLARLGIEISRRTVAKYRDQLGIAPACRRRSAGDRI